MSIAVLYGSSRANGNTEVLTEHVVKGLQVNKLFLKDYHIKDIIDQRHEENGFDSVDDDYDKVIDSVLESDVIIFATPIYWYGMSGIMKSFVDRWSQTVRDKRYPEFKSKMAQKTAYVIAVGGDEPKTKGLPLIQQFSYICNFIGLDFQGYILGKGVKPNDILIDEEALINALNLRKSLAE
ncbi:flavodoxin family protein [Pseudalkalibacillus hwajinpoensis]|uniref:Flavodoxin family protein n=1 Tax=Guptibacillus hwajinpoensis TaxID=208199 RepID=A0A4U1MJK5_9BACL|nr:flavodoxin family protein [Pseudalkalibacillus hwajinpoensis]TKD70774.1 flavodoxin family protein [Pseudalkalibacillus hwajinpoensis]